MLLFSLRALPGKPSGLPLLIQRLHVGSRPQAWLCQAKAQAELCDACAIARAASCDTAAATRRAPVVGQRCPSSSLSRVPRCSGATRQGLDPDRFTMDRWASWIAKVPRPASLQDPHCPDFEAACRGQGGHLPSRGVAASQNRSKGRGGTVAGSRTGSWTLPPHMLHGLGEGSTATPGQPERATTAGASPRRARLGGAHADCTLLNSAWWESIEGCVGQLGRENSLARF